MGKSASSPPPAPDPKVTIQAQSAANADTARLNAQLNRVNQVTPFGSITYSQAAQPMDRNVWEQQRVNEERARIDALNQRGRDATMHDAGYDEAGNKINLPTGDTYREQIFDQAAFRASLAGQEVPMMPGQDTWTQTTTLSPEQQRLYDLTTRGQTTYGETANTLLDNVRGQLSQPVNTDWESYRKNALAAQLSRLQPDYDRQQEALRQRLINSGLTAGSEGWQREMDQFQRGYNDALLQADLRAGDTVGQGIQQTAALRGMPLNEAAALLSGSQVQIPQLQGTPQTQVAPTDVMGAYQNQYQGQLAQWQANQQANNAALGGLFGLAGTLGGKAIGKWF